MFKKESVCLFWGTALMLLFACFSFTLLRDINDVLFIEHASQVSMLPFLKMRMIPLSILVGLILAGLSWKGNVTRLFSVFFPVNALLLGFYGWLQYTGSSLLESAAIVNGFYVWIGATMAIPVVLTWGLANQRYSFKMAAAQYPLLGLIAPNVALFASGRMLLLLSNQWVDVRGHVILGVAAVISILTLVIALNLPSLEQEEEEAKVSVTAGYWVALALAAAAVKFSAVFPELIVKAQLKVWYPTGAEYMAFMRVFSITKTVWGGVASAVGIVLGIVAYLKGIRVLFKLLGGIALGVLGTGVLAFTQVGGPAPEQFSLFTDLSGFILFGALGGLFHLMQNLAFFGINREHRFAAKILIDLILLSQAKGLSSFVSMMGVNWMGSVSLSSGFYLSVFVLAMLGALFFIYQMHRQCKRGLDLVAAEAE